MPIMIETPQLWLPDRLRERREDERLMRQAGLGWQRRWMPQNPCCCGGKTCPPYLVVEFTGVDYSHTCDQWEDVFPNYGNPQLASRATNRPWCLTRRDPRDAAIGVGCSYAAHKAIPCPKEPLNGFLFYVVNVGSEDEPEYRQRLYHWRNPAGYTTPPEGLTVTFERSCDSPEKCQTFTKGGITLAFVSDDRPSWATPDFTNATATIKLPSGDACDGWSTSAVPVDESYVENSQLGAINLCDPPVPICLVAEITDAKLIGVAECSSMSYVAADTATISGSAFLGDTVTVRWGHSTPGGFSGLRTGMTVESVGGGTFRVTGGAGDVIPAGATTGPILVVKSTPRNDANGSYVLRPPIPGIHTTWGQWCGFRYHPVGDVSIAVWPTCKPPYFNDGVAVGDGPHWRGQIQIKLDGGSIFSIPYTDQTLEPVCWPDDTPLELWYSSGEGKIWGSWLGDPWDFSHEPYSELSQGTLTLTAHGIEIMSEWVQLTGKSSLAAKAGYPSYTGAKLTGKSSLAAVGGTTNLASAHITGKSSLNAMGGPPPE